MLYLFNVQTTVFVEANSEAEAYEILNNGDGDERDRDVMLVGTE